MARLLLQLLALQFIFIATVFGLFGSSNKLKGATKYQLQQKVLTLGSSYTIKDDHDKPVYKVGFKQLGVGKHLQLTDVSGAQEFYSIKHVLNPLGLAKYEIRSHNQVVAEVNRKINLIGGKKFSVKSKHGTFKIEGNFRSREFKIKNGHHLVATVSKKFFAIGDKYGVQIEQGQDVPFILSLAIVIDEVAHG
ncbi:unnamed protein product [Rotaria socialis]|uniref:Uncharacterized protein n=2 Tax=Rotaria socialis TaxID=392032 RepID=A0A820XYU5_9BILA|nr:unnamed protein product [Rotaria socialis]CAF3187316.1 unnamed protein product [Rotaria socialis]CAF3301611.1 unnamed protein product [Rotaria socialis]CAF3338617.1 unnamed protein product [Rotaria socialis]CAF3416448.1 unnamed protein product [Rotaria socialis]